MTTRHCFSSTNCGNVRTCAACAKRRQNKYSNLATQLEEKHGQLTLTVLIPDQNTQDEIRRLRASFLRRALAPAGIWSIETGEEFAGLHINILSPKPLPAKFKRCKTHVELVRTTAAAAGAYITKRSGMPPPEQYAGHLAGTFGQLYEYMTAPAAAPIIQGAALESMLSGNPPRQPATGTDTPAQDWTRYNPDQPPRYTPETPSLCNPPLVETKLTIQEHQDLARTYLPNLYASIRKREPEPADHPNLIIYDRP